MSRPTLARRSAAEAVGTAALLCAVVGSGVMAERLAGGNAALALLANTLATGTALFALIATFGPVSGAHFNPLVTAATARSTGMPPPAVAVFAACQLGGAFAGVALAHAMFEEPWFSASQNARPGLPRMLGEFVATFGLIAIVAGAGRGRPDHVPFAVAGWIMAAYWFTSSTSFANPVVTLARAASDTLAGIRPADVPGFLAAQAAGAFCAVRFSAWLLAPRPAP